MHRPDRSKQATERQGIGRPLRRFFGKQAGDQFVEFRGHVGHERRHTGRYRSPLLVDHFGQLRAAKWW